MAANYNGRVLKMLGDLGYHAEVVERWDAFSRRKHDLFGIVDILAVAEGHTLAVQVTSRGNMSARRIKAVAAPAIHNMLMAGWTYEVWGFDQPKGKGTAYRLKVQRMVLGNGALEWRDIDP